MDLDGFWNIVDSACAASGPSDSDRVEALRQVLVPLPGDELESFQNCYDQMLALSYRWDIWGAAYVINLGCSDDGFRYFRDWLISEGRSTFEAALKDPESLAALPKMEGAGNESYGYVALKLFEKNGAPRMKRPFAKIPPEPKGDPWEEKEVYKLFPKLAAIYNA